MPTPTKPRCDCLNECGDDPNVKKGLVQPCQDMCAHQQAVAVCRAAAGKSLTRWPSTKPADPEDDVLDSPGDRFALSLIHQVKAAMRSAENKGEFWLDLLFGLNCYAVSELGEQQAGLMRFRLLEALKKAGL